MRQLYEVTLPIIGYAVVLVEATDEKDAIDEALADVSSDDLESWEAVPRIVSGNVFHGTHNVAIATLAE